MPKLTAKFIENVKPRATRVEIPDSGCTGLYLVVQPSGSTSWAVRYRYAGKPKKLTLDGAGSLKAARAAATTALREVELKRDPAQARRTAKDEAALAAGNTVRAVAEAWFAHEGRQLRTAHQRRRILDRQIFPLIGNMPVRDVRRSHVAKMLDKIEIDSGPRSADVAFAALSRIFTWFTLRDDDFRHPLTRGMQRARPPAERARTRVLNDDEIGRIWRAAGDLGPTGAGVRFALLVPARRGEIYACTQQEIVDGVWHLPASRSKTKVELVRPLSRAALDIVDAQPIIAGSNFIFTASGRMLTDHGGLKRQLDELSGVKNWVFHDLRRTARSLLSRAGVPFEVAERVLGHAVGNIVARTYDRHTFEQEMKNALEKLASLIERIVNPPEDNIVSLRR